MKTRLNIVETFRVDTQTDADQAIEDARAEAEKNGYEITATKATYKSKKAKGAIVDEGWEVMITKHYQDFWFDGAF